MGHEGRALVLERGQPQVEVLKLLDEEVDIRLDRRQPVVEWGEVLVDMVFDFNGQGSQQVGYSVHFPKIA